MGSSLTLISIMQYGVVVLGVRNRDLASIIVSVMSRSPGWEPALFSPSMAAYSDVAGIPLMNASTPRDTTMKSFAFSTVSLLGMPSK